MSCCGCFSGLFGAEKLPPIDVVVRKKDMAGAEAWVKSVKKSTAALEDAMKTAVQNGNLSAKTKMGCIILNESVRVGDEAIPLVKALLEAEADPNERDGKGQTAMDVAKQSGKKKMIEVLKQTSNRKKTQDFQDGLMLLPKVPLFSTLHQAEFPRLAMAFQTRTYSKGETVVKQGEPGEELFLIQEGKAEVSTQQVSDDKPRKLADLTKGSHFGESALLNGGARNATVIAVEDLVVKVLSRPDFVALGLKGLNIKGRKAVMTGDEETAAIDPALLKKTPQEAQQVKAALLANKNLGPLVKAMSDKDLELLPTKAYRMEVKPGQEVITQGQVKADNFYVISKGNFDAIVGGKKVGEYKGEGSFGELALLFRAPRAATVKATTAGTLFALPRQELRDVMQAPLKKKLEGFTKMLDRVDLFKQVGAKEKAMLADALVETTFSMTEDIMKQGERGDTFYILYDGEVEIKVNGKVVAKQSGDPNSSKVEFFGERALLNDEPRAATVTCCSWKAKVLALDREVFLMVVQPKAKRSSLSEADLMTYDFKKLKRVGLLGCGGFGKVTLEKCQLSGNMFALKALSKGHILQQKQEKSIMNEKGILKMTHSPFLVRVAATFNGPQDYLYFLLEPAMGGELFTVYAKNNFHGSEKHARFYAACVLRAFQHLHQRQIIYRDLKPENLLLDARGYCKVTDFGLAKFVIGHTYTTCGTPDYFAPEMVMGLGHSLAVDWWTLGVLIFELVTGDTPFSADDAVFIFRKVKQGISAVTFPSTPKSPWPSLVRALLKEDPSERLPLRKGGAKNVEEHDWYKCVNFDWASLDSRTMPAPYKPNIKNMEDLSNFEASEEDAPPVVPYNNPRNNWDADFEDKRGPKKFD